jgi:hypothetical protein
MAPDIDTTSEEEATAGYFLILNPENQYYAKPVPPRAH